MRALENVATAHLILADSYRDLALRHLEDVRTEAPAYSATRTTPGRQARGSAEAAPRHHPGEVAAAFLQLSLHEYREALERDPTNTAALNQFARAFWQWRLAAADRVLSREPTLAHAREAEWNARRAVSIVEAKLGRTSARLVVPDRSRDAQDQLARVVPKHTPSTGRDRPGQPRRGPARAGARARSPGGARLRPGARARAPDVRRRPLDARPRVAVRCVPGVPDRLPAEVPPSGLARHAHADGRGAARAHRRPAPGGGRRTRPRAGAPAHARRAALCRSHGRHDVAGGVPPGLARTRQRARGQAIRYVLREEEPASAATLCADAWACGCRGSPVKRPCTFACGGGAWSASVSRRTRTPSARSDVVSLAPTTSRFYYFVQLESEDFRPLSLALALGPAGPRRRWRDGSGPGHQVSRGAEPRSSSRSTGPRSPGGDRRTWQSRRSHGWRRPGRTAQTLAPRRASAREPYRGQSPRLAGGRHPIVTPVRSTGTRRRDSALAGASRTALAPHPSPASRGFVRTLQLLPRLGEPRSAQISRSRATAWLEGGAGHAQDGELVVAVAFRLPWTAPAALMVTPSRWGPAPLPGRTRRF